MRRLSLEPYDISSIWQVSPCVCTCCVYGKIASKPFSLVLPWSKLTQPLQIVYNDIARPINPKSLGGTLCLLLFTNDFTRYMVSYLLKR